MNRILCGYAYDDEDDFDFGHFSSVRTATQGAVSELFIMAERALNEPIGCPGFVARSSSSSCMIRQTRRTPSIFVGLEPLDALQ